MSNRVEPAFPRISLVTPSFQRAAFIRAALDSAATQSRPAFEHVVVDGGSTDGTVALLGEYPALRWISEPDRGVSDALNKGIRMCSGDVIGWLNTDDCYLPGALQAVADYFARHPDTDVLYGNYFFVDPSGRILQDRRELGPSRFMLFYLHMHYMPSCATFFHRRVFESGELFSEDCRYAMDFELNLRLYLKGFRFRHLRRHLATFTCHPGSISTEHAGRQTAEFERALMTHDPFLRSLPRGLRRPVRQVLKLGARATRTALKACRGFYWQPRTTERDT